MGMGKLATLAGLLSLVVANAENCTFEEISPSKKLTWCPCEDQFFCAKLEVPLDYQNLDLGRAVVPLLKVPAAINSTDGAYKGMILVNPGGPGGSGIDLARGNGTLLQSVAGTNWDVVGFDPRGMYLSEPVARCPINFTSDQNELLRKRSVPRLTDDNVQSFIDFGKQLGERCEETSGGEKDAGPHMTTAVNARDMISIVDAFAETEEGKKASKDPRQLNYYGLSYGTFIGQTVASMFPERMGNVAVDAVVGPESYLVNFSQDSITHVDEILGMFFVYCHEAGKDLCPYYTGSTPKDIFNRFNQSFVQLDAQKAKAENWANATDVEDALLSLKAGILGIGYYPFTTFPAAAQAFLVLEEAIAKQEPKRVFEVFQQFIGADPRPQGVVNGEYNAGVFCSDTKNRLYNRTVEEFRPIVEKLEEQSIVGEVWGKSAFICAGWSIKSDDIFIGPFGGKTAMPMLFVSNTMDPVTPIENSISGAPMYKDAEILTVDGMGHGIVNTNNICGFGKLRAYFQNDELPGEDNYCPLERGPFDVTLQGTLKENLEKAGLTDLSW